MASGKERVLRAVEQCEEDGYERSDGMFVDPLPVQKVAIHEGFRQATEDSQFDIWTVVTPGAVLQEDRTIAENFEAVVEQWDKTVDQPEVKQRLEEIQRRYEKEG